MLPSTPTVSPQRLHRVLSHDIKRAAHTPGADRYRKVFPAFAHLWILVLHSFSGLPSLRQTHAWLAVQPRRWQGWGLPHWISRSQLTRSSTSRDSACFETLLTALLERAKGQTVRDPDWQRFQRVLLLDSSFIRLSNQLCPWSRHGKFTPGVRLQLALQLLGRLPVYLRLSTVAVNDHRALRELPLEDLAGWTLICDRGYYGHQELARLRAAGVDSITPANPQAAFVVLADQHPDGHPDAHGHRVLVDQTIRLGSPNNRRGAVLADWRLVEVVLANGMTLRLVTSRHDLTPLELAEVYRKRWQIELFFRLLKRTLGMLRPLGRSPQALWLTVLLAVIVALILQLVLAARPPDTSWVAWLRSIQASLGEVEYALRL